MTKLLKIIQLCCFIFSVFLSLEFMNIKGEENGFFFILVSIFKKHFISLLIILEFCKCTDLVTLAALIIM